MRHMVEIVSGVTKLQKETLAEAARVSEELDQQIVEKTIAKLSVVMSEKFDEFRCKNEEKLE